MRKSQLLAYLFLIRLRGKCVDDALELNRSIGNLLTNAIRHNPVGSLLSVGLMEEPDRDLKEAAVIDLAPLLTGRRRVWVAGETVQSLLRLLYVTPYYASCGAEKQEIRTACKVQPRWLFSQRGCSWYFIVSKVVTGKCKNQYYEVHFVHKRN